MKKKKERQQKMDAWLIVFVVLVLVILIVGIAFAIFYSPNYQPRHNGTRRKHVPNYVLGLRSQIGTDVLPVIGIDTTPTDISLNQPMCDAGFVKIARSGVYQVTYGVDIQFASPAIVSVAIRRRSSDGCKGFEILTGSARQVSVAQPSVVPVNNSFFAQLNNGDQIKITAVASVTDSVFVPASNASFLQSPEALASLQLTLQS